MPRADPDGPGCMLREPTIRIVIERLVAVEFFAVGDTEPQLTQTTDDVGVLARSETTLSPRA